MKLELYVCGQTRRRLEYGETLTTTTMATSTGSIEVLLAAAAAHKIRPRIIKFKFNNISLITT